MKKRAISFILAAILTFSLLSPAFAAEGGTGEELYVNTQELIDGFSYTNPISKNASDKRVETFSVETTPGSPVYPIVMAEDMIYSSMTIDKMVEYAESIGLNVHAAVNADFFYNSMSMPLGGVIQDGEFITDMNGETMLAFGGEGAFFVKTPVVTMTLRNHGGGEYADETGATHSNAGLDVQVSHYNKVRTRTGGMFLYTDDYHTSSTQTSLPGWAVIFRILEGSVTVSGQVELEVEKVVPEGTDYALDPEHMVLTAQTDSDFPDTYKSFSEGDNVTLVTECSDASLLNARWATGCGDALALDGALTDKESWDKALTEIHPRTALGIKPDGSVIAYVVDGRQGNYSYGALMEEVAIDLLARGCQTVVNLDGGGSSVISVRLPGQETCEVVNKPSDGKPRSCSTYILFVSDTEADGVAARLGVEQDGAFVLAGSSLPLDFLATDKAGMPANVPEDIEVTPEFGSFENGVYTAGDSAGVDVLTLWSPSLELQGEARIHVVTGVDSVSVTDALTGEKPALLELKDGDVISLNVSASYLSRPVMVEQSLVEYTLTEGMGNVTNGVLTITEGDVYEGTLTAALGGMRAEFPVAIKKPRSFSDVAGHWAEEDITLLWKDGVVGGYSDGTFRPDVPMTRAEFVTMLWNALGKPEMDAECAYDDVAADSWYYAQVVWSQAIGVTNGSGNGLFDPEGDLTREQGFTMIYRLLSIMRLELPDPDSVVLDGFPDAGDVSEYAREGLSSLIQSGVVNGVDGRLDPKVTLTRAQMAALLVRSLFRVVSG